MMVEGSARERRAWVSVWRREGEMGREEREKERGRVLDDSRVFGERTKCGKDRFERKY